MAKITMISIDTQLDVIWLFVAVISLAARFIRFTTPIGILRRQQKKRRVLDEIDVVISLDFGFVLSILLCLFSRRLSYLHSQKWYI